MRLTPGAQVRGKTNLNLRNGPDVTQPRVATLQEGALAVVVKLAANGWVLVKVNGWVHESDLSTIYSEADKRSSVDAKRGPAGDEWQAVTVVGYVNSFYLAVEDGPQ